MVFQVRMVKRYGKENRIKKAENTRSRPIFSTAISSDNLLCSRGRLNVPRKMYIGIAEILLTVHTHWEGEEGHRKSAHLFSTAKMSLHCVTRLSKNYFSPLSVETNNLLRPPSLLRLDG